MRKSFFVLIGLSVGLLLIGQTGAVYGGGGGGGGGDSDPAVSSSTSGDPSKGPDGFQQSSTQHQFPQGTGPIILTSDPPEPLNVGQAGTTDDPNSITSPAPVQSTSSRTTDDPAQPHPPSINLTNEQLAALGLPPLLPTTPLNVFINQATPVMGPLQGGIPTYTPPPRINIPPVGVAGVQDPRIHAGPIDEATELENIEMTSRIMGHAANMLMSAYGTPVVKIFYGASTGAAGSYASGDPPMAVAWNAAKGALVSVITLEVSPVPGEIGTVVINSVGPVDLSKQPRVPVGGAL